MRKYIPIHTRVALTLASLGGHNILIMCVDLYEIAHSIASMIIREYCEAIKIHVRPLVYLKPTLPCITKKFTFDSKHLHGSLQLIFQFIQKKTKNTQTNLHGIPNVLGIINGSHIPIIAPSWDAASYYCRKGFDSALLQRVVDTRCRLWENVIKACQLFSRMNFISFQNGKSLFNNT